MSSYHLLILLGFLCQGLASQHILWAVGFALLWVVALRFRGPRPILPERYEAVPFALGLFLVYRLIRLYDLPLFVGLGYPLLVLQLIRLTGPVDARKKLWCTAMAITHVAIGSQAVFDFQFILLLIAALILVPRTLAELESERFQIVWKPRPLEQLRFTTSLILAMAVFFVLVPRTQIRSRGMSLGFVSPMLDPASGGGQTRDRLLFRVEGQNLSYLKTWTMDTYDGLVWTNSNAGARKLRGFETVDPRRHLERKVTILDPDALGMVLPADGRVVSFQADFAPEAFVAVQGTVVVKKAKLKDANPTYVFWSDPEPRPEPLEEELRERYTALPAQPETLYRWIDGVIGREKDALAQAQRLATHLRENFTYRLGAPSLDRMTPLEDFLFQQKEGHCERFASALTVLLRMQGIPARVAIGFLPLEKYREGDTQKLTEKQGHAWTEAWFEDKGWVQLDSTPYSDNIGGLPQPLFATAYEWIQDFWYQKVVFYSSSERQALLQSALGVLRAPVDLLVNVLPGAFGLLGTLGTAAAASLLLLALLRRWKGWRWRASGSLERARHVYARMLQVLERHGHRRAPAQTPRELLTRLRTLAFPGIEDVERITESFCATRYRGTPLTPEEQEALEASLRRLNTLNPHTSASRKPG